jgi:hypothetical protein
MNTNTCDGLCHGSCVTNWHFVIGFSFVSKTGVGSERAVSVFPPCKFHVLNTLSNSANATGGAEIATDKQYGFHLYAKTYIVSSGSSDSISFDTMVGGLFRISIFSIGPKLF